MRRILIIGGNRYMGYGLVWRLLAAGDRVTTVNRGLHADPFADRIERLHADRRTQAFAEALRGRTFDAVVDFAAFDRVDAQGAVAALHDRVGHYVFISTGSVYMSLEGVSHPCSRPMPETAYAGKVMPVPEEQADYPNWRYGTGKRAAEDTLMAAWSARRFPATCLRLPSVIGELDPDRRIENYLWRILDGGPVLLPDGGENTASHAYCGSVVRAIGGVLGRESTFGEAFNISQDECPTVRALVAMLADLIGAPDRALSIGSNVMIEAGLAPRTISPFSAAWASWLDPARAKAELGFCHEPLTQYLDKIVGDFLNHPPATPPEEYAGRAAELELARRSAPA